MKQIFKKIVFGLVLFISLQIKAKSIDFLFECWNKQVKPVKEKHLAFTYRENYNEFEHSFEPWQQTSSIGKGIVWTNENNFLKQDTLVKGKNIYFSKAQFSKNEFLFMDYGDVELFATTNDMFMDQTFNSARYSPIILINYFFKHNITIDNESDSAYAVYKIKINKTIVKLYIDKLKYLLYKVTIFNNNELFGDVLTTFHYSNYSTLNNLYYSKKNIIEKYNGKIIDEINVLFVNVISRAPILLQKPINYTLKDDFKSIPEIKIQKYSDNITFIEIKETNDRIMVVEFDNFLLVDGAPLNSKNGELIISEAKKIAQYKPIKYFTFGHHHPHYIGGIRPFIHKDAIVITTKSDLEYVKFLASAPHTLDPDSLELQPKNLLIEEIDDSKLITDGKFEMRIYLIGKKSEHTNDYLIYYFPKEELLFEDDLVWITQEGDIRKANKRQAGLYNAVNQLGLKIKTIIQSWPVSDYGIKTIIPFSELEKSMISK